jgi:Fur family ferric uptake transcriptional regulator
MKRCRHPRPEVSELPELTQRLRDESRKITGPRQAILDVLHSHPHPLTNKEIHSCLAGADCDLATIYRSMHLLTRLGLVKRYHFGGRAARFELVTRGRAGHHHHLVCTKCSEVVEIEECFPMELERRIAERNGFKEITHSLEFFGLCPGCQTG